MTLSATPPPEIDQPVRHDDGALDGAAASVDARRAADRARDRRRERREGRARDRLPAHRHREKRRGALLDAGADRHRAHGLSRAVVKRALLRLGGRETARHYRSDSAARADDSRADRRADAHRLALRLAGHARHRPRRDLRLLLLLRPAREHPRSARSVGRRAHASELPARRRPQRRSARRSSGTGSTR